MKTSSSSWIASAVLYQINLRSLAAREPRNAIEAATEKPLAESPLAYLTRHLPRLRRLGVNTLYLLPPYPIGQFARKGIGSPYASRDFTAVDPEYGTRAEIIGFIRRAHELRFKVLFDITPNHTARDHVWMTEHPEYYVKAPDGYAFYDCDWSDTAKLDYTQPGVREAMIEACDFWLRVAGEPGDSEPDGVDGFRMDVAHLLNDLGFWNQALPELRRRHPKRSLLFLAECYGLANNLDLFARGFDAAYDDDFYKVCQHLYGLDETGQTGILPAADPAANPGFTEWVDAFHERGPAGAMESVLLAYESRLPPGPAGPRLARYTDNHDEGRGVYRFGEGAVLALNQLIFLAGHTLPFLLAGQEFGAVNRPSIHQRVGLCDKGPRRREGGGQRTEPGIEFEGNLFARGRARRRGWYEFYRELIALRAQCPELTGGDFTLLEAGERCPPSARTVVAFQRRLGDSVLRCAVNLGPEPRPLAHAHLFQRGAVYGGIDDGVLAPFASMVVRTRL